MISSIGNAKLHKNMNTLSFHMRKIKITMDEKEVTAELIDKKPENCKYNLGCAPYSKQDRYVG